MVPPGKDLHKEIIPPKNGFCAELEHLMEGIEFKRVLMRELPFSARNY
jgi:hypothetical protein